MKTRNRIISVVLSLLFSSSVLQAFEQSSVCVPCEDPCCCDSNFHLRADFLYWTPRITGLEWGFGRTEIDETVVDCTQILHTEEVDCDPKFKWSPGLRLGAGWGCDQWAVDLLWTHFNGNAAKHSLSKEYVFNNGKVRVYFDQFDLAFSFNCNSCGCVSLEPFIGLRVANLREKVKSHSAIEILLNPNVVVMETRDHDDKQDYWGGGPLFGLKADWEVGCGVDLYGLIAGSLLYGKYEVRWNDTDIYTGGISKELYNKNKKHVRGFDYNLDLAIGVNWNVWSCGTRSVDMSLGFEHHQYWNQSRLCVGRGDVSFTGGVYSVDFNF